MENSKKTSFTQGSVGAALIRFSLPVLGALILQAAYGAVDLLVIGIFSDASGISAVGTGSSFMAMVTFIITSLAMGSTVTIGKHMGERNAKKAGDAVGTTIILFAVIGVVFTLIFELCTGFLVKILQVPAEAAEKTSLYLHICFGGIIIIIAYNVISSILRGIGNSNLPLLFVGIACMVNIIGDFLFVGVFKMDVAGAALATVLAQFVSVVISLFVLARQNLEITFSRNQLRIYKKELKYILGTGIPIALQETTVQISFLVINSIVNGMGLMPSAGYGVAQKAVTFIMLIPSALMQSLSAFVAQNIGAGKKKRAIQGFFTAMAGGSVIGLFMFCLGFFGGSVLSGIFTNDTAVIAESAAYLKGFCSDCILTCILFSFIGYFNGCGISIPVMLQGMISALCIRIPVSLYMSQLPNTTLTMVGLAAPISSIFGILFFIVCFKIISSRKSAVS